MLTESERTQHKLVIKRIKQKLDDDMNFYVNRLVTIRQWLPEVNVEGNYQPLDVQYAQRVKSPDSLPIDYSMIEIGNFPVAPSNKGMYLPDIFACVYIRDDLVYGNKDLLLKGSHVYAYCSRLDLSYVLDYPEDVKRFMHDTGLMHSDHGVCVAMNEVVFVLA